MTNMTTAWWDFVFGFGRHRRRRRRIRTNHTHRIRTFFFLLVILGSILIIRNYIRQERMLVFLDTYNALLVREKQETNHWFLDQPSSLSTIPRTTTNKSVRTISTSSSLSSSSLSTRRRRNLVPLSSSNDDEDDSDTTRGEEEGRKKRGENDHRRVRSISSERQHPKRPGIQNHTENKFTGRSHHTNTSTIDVRDNDDGNDDHSHNRNHNRDTTTNITPITGIIPSQEEEEEGNGKQQQQQQSQLPLSQPQQLLPLLQLDHRPTDNNTAIMLVAMGIVSNTTWLTERCILSIRTGGQFTGYIIVITDKEGYAKYSQTVTSIPIHGNNNYYHHHPPNNPNPTTETNSGNNIDGRTNGNGNSSSYDDSIPNNNNNSKVIVIKTTTEDMSPKTKDGATIQYYQKRTHMLYKRYKTLVLQYLEHAFDDGTGNSNNGNNGKSTHSIEHVLYLDIDNIVAQPLSNFFDDYYHSINAQLVETATKTTLSIQQQLQQLPLNTKNDNKKSTTTTTTTTTTSDNNNNNSTDSFVRSNSTTNTTMFHNRKKEESESSKNDSSNTNPNSTTGIGTATEFSFFSFWKDPHVTYKQGLPLWQSGQIMFSTRYSQHCVDAWREEMDQHKQVMDQIVLFHVYIHNNFGNTQHPTCLFFELPNTSSTSSTTSSTTISHDKNNNNNNNSSALVDSSNNTPNSDQKRMRKHFELLSKDITNMNDTSHYPTIVHLTQTRIETISTDKNQEFLRHSLLLDVDVNDSDNDDDNNELLLPALAPELEVIEEEELENERRGTERKKQNVTTEIKNDNDNDNENELTIRSRHNSDTSSSNHNKELLMNSVKTRRSTTKEATTTTTPPRIIVVDGRVAERHNTTVTNKAEHNLITWNNQTIGWNEIIQSFQGGKEQKKKKREEKKKKNKNKKR